ncbi:hypothetical protein K439DRAFT_1663555 [Ramaria rubella]|nr:hypothetical protein K439DRAFT_1663555 [Ramaria rubella]
MFLVNNTLFKVHKTLITGSEMFTGMFAFAPGDKPPQGLTDDDPVILKDPVTAKKFEHLLGYFYPVSRGHLQMFHTSGVKLADLTTPEMEAAQQLAISELDCWLLTAPERLLLAQRYNHKPWLSIAFRYLLRKKYTTPTLQ